MQWLGNRWSMYSCWFFHYRAPSYPDTWNVHGTLFWKVMNFWMQISAQEVWFQDSEHWLIQIVLIFKKFFFVHLSMKLQYIYISRQKEISSSSKLLHFQENSFEFMNSNQRIKNRIFIKQLRVAVWSKYQFTSLIKNFRVRYRRSDYHKRRRDDSGHR